MPLIVPCPQCNTKLRAPDHWVGKAVNCPKCGAPVQIGAPAAEPAALQPLSPAPGHQLQPLGPAAGPQLQPLGSAPPMQPLGGFPAPQPMQGFPGQQPLPQHDPFAALGGAGGFAAPSQLHPAAAKPAAAGPNVALIAGIGGGVVVLLIVIVAIAMNMGRKPVVQNNPPVDPATPVGPTVPGPSAAGVNPSAGPTTPAPPQVKPIEFTPLPELKYASFPGGWKMPAKNFLHFDLCPDHFVSSDQGYYVGSLATGEKLWQIGSDAVAHYPPEQLLDADHAFYRHEARGGSEKIEVIAREGEPMPIPSFGRYTGFQLMRSNQVAVTYKQGPDDDYGGSYPHVVKVFDVVSQKKKWDVTIPRPQEGKIWEFVMYPHADAGALITYEEGTNTIVVSPLHVPDLQVVARTPLTPPQGAGVQEMRPSLTLDGSQLVLLIRYTSFRGPQFGPLRLVTLRTDNAARVVDCMLEADWGEPFLFQGGPQLIPPNRAWMIRDKREVRVYDYATGKKLLTGPAKGVYIGDGNTFLVRQKDTVVAMPIPWDRMEAAKAAGAPPATIQW